MSIELYTRRPGKGVLYEYWGEYDTYYDAGLPEGLWIVYKNKNSHGIEYVPKTEDEIVVPRDIQRRFTLKERIVKVLLKEWKEPRSLQDLAKAIAEDLIPRKRRRKKNPRFKVR